MRLSSDLSPTASLPSSPRSGSPTRVSRSAPDAGPTGLSLLRHHLRILRDPLAGIHEVTARYGSMVRMDWGPFVFWLANDPDAIKHVLVDNAKAYHKSRNYDGLRLALGKGLVTSEGELWRAQRKLVAPAFTPARIQRYVPAFVKAAEDAADGWRAGTDRSRTDVHHDMMALTFRIVGHTLFGTELGADADRIGPAFEEVLRFAEDYSMSLVRIPHRWPTPANYRFDRALATLDALVERIVRERRERLARGGDAGEDVLAALLAARDESGREMDARQLRDEVLTLVGAGHETTANALSFTLYLLSLHPHWERRVVEEIRGISGERSPSMEELGRMSLLERVIEESMRLLPPVWGFERQAQEDDVVLGRRIDKGHILGVSTWTLHRMPEYWENPEGFDPDRFLPERKKERPRFAYVPFGAGPRICLGASFAMLEAKAILAVLLRRFRFEVASGYRLVPEPLVTLRPKGGIAMVRHFR
ncbi:MAG: cytochrome P450 [Sandaracinaceae bacterium]|nr:cytochrome P450 [Sandaracinaceae bacterium]